MLADQLITENHPVYTQAKYLTSAAEIDQLPPDSGCEVALIGRSNAGKSSALNVITGIKGLARTSKTPGRTQMINFFALNKYCRLVDLPGYGYAKVPRTIKNRWQHIVGQYLQHRKCLKGLILVMDIRHPLKDLDRQMIHWALQCHVAIHILLTKADKLSSYAARKVLNEVEQDLACAKNHITLQIFSSLDRTGLDDILHVLNHWFTADLENLH